MFVRSIEHKYSTEASKGVGRGRKASSGFGSGCGHLPDPFQEEAGVEGGMEGWRRQYFRWSWVAWRMRK